MCCRRRHRRAPIVVILGKMAYDKYQEHKQNKQAMAMALASSSSPEYGTLQQSTRSAQPDISAMEKLSIGPAGAPPAYNDVIVYRTAVPDEKATVSAEDKKLSDDDLSDHESIYSDARDGAGPGYETSASASASMAQPGQSWSERKAEKWAKRREEKNARMQQKNAKCRTWCEEKRAAKEARRAQRAD